MESSKMFRRSLFAVILFIATPALAQVLTAEQRAACMGDYDKFCKGISPGVGVSSPAFPNTTTSSRMPARKSWERSKRSNPRPTLLDEAVDAAEKYFHFQSSTYKADSNGYIICRPEKPKITIANLKPLVLNASMQPAPN